MNYWFLLFCPLMLFTTTLFASASEYVMVDPTLYELEVDEKVYPIFFEVNASVLGMVIDPESKSLLIGVENVKDSKFAIQLNHEVIGAPNDEFLILVNGVDTDYQIFSESNTTTLVFFIPIETEEVEIVGTYAIPEFPLGVIMGLFSMILLVTIIAKAKIAFFKW